MPARKLLNIPKIESKDRLPRVVGILPERLFWPSCRDANAVSRPSSAGIEPIREFRVIPKRFSSDSCPISLGIGPVR